MRTILFTLLAIFAFAATSHAQDSRSHVAKDHPDGKLIILVNTAKWCPTCKANGMRVKENVLGKCMDNPNYKVLINDLSDDNTKKESALLIEKAGLAAFTKENKTTGMIYLIDSETHNLISQIRVSKSNEDITASIEKSLNKATSK